MSLEFPSNKVPLGEAKKLNDAKNTWSTTETKNEVVWVNNQIDFPFKINVGERTNLAALLSLDKSDTREVELEKDHTRSAILGRVIFRDKQGNFYRDVDLKGIGLSIWVDGIPIGTTTDDIDKPRLRPGEVPGLQRIEAAHYEADFAEKLVKIGIRTSRVIAIARLDEINATEGILSIEDAVKNKILPSGFTPAVTIRAFGTRSRQGEGGTISREKLFYEDARILVAEELGIGPERFTWKDYMKWFAENIARNIGLLHKNGMYFKYLLNLQGHPSNVTLDCRLVDQESVGYLNHFKSVETREKLIRTDLQHMEIMVLGMNDEIREIFEVDVENDTELRGIIKSTYRKIGNIIPEKGIVFEQ